MGSKRYVPMRKSISTENLILKGVPAEYIECNIESYTDNNSTKKLVKNYIENIHTMYEDRVCLLFYGSNGTGKTLLSSIIVKEAYRRRYSSHITTLAHYMDLCFSKEKSEEQQEEIHHIREAEFLVIDEVGKENFTKTLSNISLLEELLRGAVARGQVVIVCTNLPLEDVGNVQGLYSLYGKSIASLLGGEFLKVKFNADDYRPNILKQKKGVVALMNSLKED